MVFVENFCCITIKSLLICTVVNKQFNQGPFPSFLICFRLAKRNVCDEMAMADP